MKGEELAALPGERTLKVRDVKAAHDAAHSESVETAGVVFFDAEGRGTYRAIQANRVRDVFPPLGAWGDAVDSVRQSDRSHIAVTNSFRRVSQREPAKGCYGYPLCSLFLLAKESSFPRMPSRCKPYAAADPAGRT